MRALPFVFVISISQVTYGASYRCVDVLDSDGPKHQAIFLSKEQNSLAKKAVKSAGNTTTGHRGENAYTVGADFIDAIIGNFKSEIEIQIHGYELKNRDPQKPGKQNVTYTAYSANYKVLQDNNQWATMKIRLRKYGEIDEGLSIRKENIQLSNLTKDHSYLEFKVEDTESILESLNQVKPRAVSKPRIIISDSHANELLNPHLSDAEFHRILEYTKQKNQKIDPIENAEIQSTVETMLATIRSLHAGNTPLAPEFETLYTRTSYKIPVYDPRTGIKDEIQITIDSKIFANSLLLGRQSKAYDDSVVVVETKIPIHLLKYVQSLAAAQASGIQGMPAIAQLLIDLDTAHLKNYSRNRGKAYHSRQDLED